MSGGVGGSEADDVQSADSSSESEDLPLLHPDSIPEYLRNLQGSLDATRARADRLMARVDKLEKDREELRRRLSEAKSVARSRSLGGRLRGVLRSAGPSPEFDGGEGPPASGEAPAQGEASAVLPVVGRVGPARWPTPAPTNDLRIGLVADPFTQTALEYEAHCLPLRAQDGVAVLRREGADLLFVESAYSGPSQTWQGRIARFGEPHEDLVRLVDTARELGIPTVFWNKEDPVNTDWFLSSARLFDHVFTVDAGLIGTYRELLGHDKVHLLMFAAQPRIHRPPKRFEDRTGPILFAGTWFAHKHAERRAQITMLLDPARERGLQILDRHIGDDERFSWPARFRRHIVGSLPYPLAVEATRLFRVVVNVNTVTDSPTMCARRVFELAACATPTVSGPSIAIRNLVPNEAIRLVHDPAEAVTAYEEILAGPAVGARMGEAAREWVLAGHRWSDRLQEVVRSVESHL